MSNYGPWCEQFYYKRVVTEFFLIGDGGFYKAVNEETSEQSSNTIRDFLLHE